jgi:hypothetical protein
MLRESVLRFTAKYYDFSRYRKTVRAGGFDGEAWRHICDQGWIAAAIGEKHGGLGGLREAAIIAEELGAALVVEPYLAAVQTADLLQGDESMRTVLNAHLAGTCLVASALAESRARGSVAHVATMAKPTVDGFIVRGKKTMVRGIPPASKLLVSARTSGAISDTHGISLFLLDAISPGILIERVRLIDGSIGANVTLSDVVADSASKVGEMHHAYPILLRSVEALTIVAGADTLGMMERVIALSIDQLKTRRQFGVLLSSFQVLQHRLADMATDLEISRAILDVALLAREEADATERSRAFASARTLIGELGRSVCAAGIQFHGGTGMTEEHPVGHYLQRLQVLDALQGHPSCHLDEYAASLKHETSQDYGYAVDRRR